MAEEARDRLGLNPLPAISADQMREIDRAMVEDIGVSLLQMMENAGRSLAMLARDRFLDGDVRGSSVVALAGPGGNGGGVLAAARHLANWGADLRIHLATPAARLTEAAATQLGTLRCLPAVELSADPGPGGDLILDGLIGYSLSGAPRGGAARLVNWTHEQDAPVLSLDVPSGLDATSGELREPAVRAAATLALALPKRGLMDPAAVDVVGELYLADIGVPPELYARTLSLDVEVPFVGKTVIRLR